MTTAAVSVASRILKQRLKDRRLPTVEVPTVEGNDELKRSLEGIQEHLRMYEGNSGAPKERFVTIAELENAGLIKADVKQGFGFISQVLNKEVAQKAGSTANPTLKDSVKTDTSRQSRIASGGSGSDKQSSVATTSKLNDLGDLNVAKPAQNQVVMYDGGKWSGFPLFSRENTWLKRQKFDRPLSMNELADSPSVSGGRGLLYAKDDQVLYYKDSAGVEHALYSGSDPILPGTVDNTTLRWDDASSQWLENPTLLAQDDGFVTLNAGANTSSIFKLGESATLRGDSQDAAFRMYGEHGGVIYGVQFSTFSANCGLSGISGNPVTTFQLSLDQQNRSGHYLRLYGPGDVEFGTLQHDDADFNLNLSSSTVNFDIRGGTRVLLNDMNFRMDARGSGASHEAEFFYDDSAERVIMEIVRETGAANVFRVNATTEGSVKFLDMQNSGNLYMHFVTGSDVRVRDGYQFRVYDTADTDYFVIDAGNVIANHIGWWGHQTSPSSTNYAALIDSSNNHLINAPGGSMFFRTSNTTRGTLTPTELTMTVPIIATYAEFNDLGPLSDPGLDDLYVGGYGIMGDRSGTIYITNWHATGAVSIGVDGDHNSNVVAVFNKQGQTLVGDTAGTAALEVTNAGTANILADFVGDSDALRIQTVGAGDYKIGNTQQDNSIVFYDGTGGVELFYNGVIAVEVDATGVALYYGSTPVEEFHTQDSNLAGQTSGVGIRDHLQNFRDGGFNDLVEIAMTTANITLDDQHAGAIIRRTVSSTVSVIMPASTSVFPNGSLCTVLNHGTGGTLSISDGSENMYFMDGSGTVVNSTGLTLAIAGVCNIWRQGGSAFYVWGVGLS